MLFLQCWLQPKVPLDSLKFCDKMLVDYEIRVFESAHFCHMAAYKDKRTSDFLDNQTSDFQSS